MSHVKFLSLLSLIVLVLGTTLADAGGIKKTKNKDGSTHYELIGTPSDTTAETPSYPTPQPLANDQVASAPAPVIVSPPAPERQGLEGKRRIGSKYRRSRERISDDE